MPLSQVSDCNVMNSVVMVEQAFALFVNDSNVMVDIIL